LPVAPQSQLKKERLRHKMQRLPTVKRKQILQKKKKGALKW
jgi:hypothetical protein